MTKPTPMKVESSGWIHEIPLQPAEHNGIMIAVAVVVGLGILPLLSDALPNGISLVIFAALAFCLIVIPPLLRTTQLKVNICPECNIRTAYNPVQKFCGRCGYRPERT